MAQQTAPRTPNSIQAQKPTAGLVALISPKSMVVIPVATNYRDTKIQQPAGSRWFRIFLNASRRCAIAQNSLKFFKILRIEVENYPIIMTMGMY
jgi:hypothetical protein